MRVQQLGYVAQGKRRIQPLGNYVTLVEPRSYTNKIINPNGSVYDTLDLMEQIVTDCSYQVHRLALQLVKEAGGNPNSAAYYKRIFDFCYNHIQYKEDEPGVEQLREPAKAIADAKSGIDCDCYSILVASLLKEGGCKHKPNFKIVKIAGGNDYQHVYVTVNGYIIDPVVDEFNTEAKQITGQYVKGLSGLPVQQLGQIVIDENTLVDGKK